MTHASLCSGIGAAELAATWTGWENAFWCENNPFCRRVLKYWFNKSKEYGDIRKADFTEWLGRIDVLTAGFPCQPFSIAGRRKGADDNRYLWPEIIRVIREVRPRWFIGENVAGITSMVQSGSEVEVESERDLFGTYYRKTVLRQRYILGTILEDIERAGYAVQPVIIPACAVGAPHQRDRVFIIAHRTDTGAKSMPERQNGIHEYPAITDAESDRSERWCANSDGKAYDSGKRNIAQCMYQGFSIQQTIADANQLNGNVSGFCAGEISQHEASGIFENKIASDATSNGLQGKMPRYAEMFTEPFRYFPTQSPVRRRDDGFSRRLVGITLSNWRNESIEAFGNAIVPQVMYEIFKIINTINNL